MKLFEKFEKNDEAVSPVIGVILMVAITVILAAVIAAFVFGMTDNVQTQKTVGMTAQISGDDITTTLVGGADLATLKNVTVKIDGKNVAVNHNEDEYGTGIISGDNVTFHAGDVITVTDKNSGQLVIAGKFSDGTEQVLFQKDFN